MTVPLLGPFTVMLPGGASATIHVPLGEASIPRSGDADDLGRQLAQKIGVALRQRLAETLPISVDEGWRERREEQISGIAEVIEDSVAAKYAAAIRDAWAREASAETDA